MSAIRNLFSGGAVVAYYPALARKLGSVSAALFVQQIAYLSEDERYTEGNWVLIDQDELEWMLALTAKVQQAARRRAVEAKVMEERRPQTRGGKMGYRVLWDGLEKLLGTPNGIPKREVNTIPKESPNGNPPIGEQGESNEEAPNGPSSADSQSSSPEHRGIGQFAITELMDRVAASQARGTGIHRPVNPSNYGKFYKERSKVHDDDILGFTLDYLVAKAGDEIEGEAKAWCGFDTALDRVLAGWRPGPEPEGVSLTGKTREQRESEAARRRSGYEWIFDKNEAESSAELMKKMFRHAQQRGDLERSLENVLEHLDNWPGVTRSEAQAIAVWVKDTEEVADEVG